MINWKKSHKVFSNPTSCLVNKQKEIPLYEHDIIDVINRTYLAKIFDELYKSDLKLKTTNICSAKTMFGVEEFTVHKYNNDNERLELWYQGKDEEEGGCAVLYANENLALITGNYCNHPFVVTPDFCFNNSDGSTEKYIYRGENKGKINIRELKKLTETLTIEYIFYQEH